MCIEVFLGSDQPQACLPNDDSWPSIQLHELYPDQEPVRQHFSKPYVYLVSAGGGCSCIFRYSPHDMDLYTNDSEETKVLVRQCIDERHQLVKLLGDFAQTTAQFGIAEIYSCWSGTWKNPVYSRINVKLSHFGGEYFHFSTGELLTIVSNSYTGLMGSFTSLKQEVEEGRAAYFQSITHDETNHTLTICFAQDPERLDVHSVLIFKCVQEYQNAIRPYDPPTPEEDEEWEEEEPITEEPVPHEYLLGILEVSNGAYTHYCIHTPIREITFYTANAPELTRRLAA